MFELIQTIFWSLKDGIRINATVTPSLVKRWWWTCPESHGFKHANIFLIGGCQETRSWFTKQQVNDLDPYEKVKALFTEMYGESGTQWNVVKLHGNSPIAIVFTHDDYWKVMMKLMDDSSWIFSETIDTDLWFDFPSNWKHQVSAYQGTDECRGTLENAMRS